MKRERAGLAARLRERFCFVMALASLIVCVPAWADDAPPPQRLVFADETPVTASPDANGTFKFDFAIKNVGGKPGDGSLTLNRKMGKGCMKVEAKGEAEVTASDAKVAIKIAELAPN